MASTSQTEMLRQLLYILRRNTDENYFFRTVPLHYKLESTNTFRSALHAFEEWRKAEQVLIPVKMKCVERKGLIYLRNLPYEPGDGYKTHLGLFNQCRNPTLSSQGQRPHSPSNSVYSMPNTAIHGAVYYQTDLPKQNSPGEYEIKREDWETMFTKWKKEKDTSIKARE